MKVVSALRESRNRRPAPEGRAPSRAPAFTSRGMANKKRRATGPSRVAARTRGSSPAANGHSGRIFVVAPNLIAAEKNSAESVESKIRSVLRCHKLCEIGRNSAYFDRSGPIGKRRRPARRSGPNSNWRFRLFRAIAADFFKFCNLRGGSPRKFGSSGWYKPRLKAVKERSQTFESGYAPPGSPKRCRFSGRKAKVTCSQFEYSGDFEARQGRSQRASIDSRRNVGMPTPTCRARTIGSLIGQSNFGSR